MHPKKAQELGVKTGDVVVLIGRRRRATYGRVAISAAASDRAPASANKKKASSVGASSSVVHLSSTLAHYLRVRLNDKVKVVALSAPDLDLKEPRSGDLKLLQSRTPTVVETITLSPVEDSYQAVVAAEGGDEISEEELMERWVRPYLETGGGGGGLLKTNMVVSLRDEATGRSLEFLVTHMSLRQPDSESVTQGSKKKKASSSKSSKDKGMLYVV